MDKIRYIKVYDKDLKKLLAVFSNESLEGEQAIEQMSSPTISMVSNGESTLSFQMFAKSEKWQDIKNPENIYECNGRYYTALNENSIEYASSDGETIANVMLIETWYLLKRKFVQVHNVDTKIEAMDEHTVKILPKTKPEFKLTVNGVAYDDSEVKDSRGVVMPRGSAGYALWGLLKGTDWKLGICDVLVDGFNPAEDFGCFNVESDMKSVLENIQFVQELYGGILVWDSVSKTCSLRDENKESDFNKWKGVSFRRDKNLKEAPNIVWDNDIITRAYPLGNGNLNIKRVNDGKTYIDNFSYTDKIYEGYLTNPNIYDTNDEGGQKTLKGWAERELAKLCKPRKSVEYQILDMRATEDYGFEEFDINDIVEAYYIDEYTGEETSEFLRVQSISYNYFNPSSDSTIEVGDKVANEREIFHQMYKKDIWSAPTDWLGFLSGLDIKIDIPEDWLKELLEQGKEDNLNDFAELLAMKTTENATSVADLRMYADATYATLEALVGFQKRTDDKFVQSDATLTMLTDELKALITLETNHYEETKDGILNNNANISMLSDNLNAQINLEASHYSNTSNSIASLQVQADNNGSRITAQANEIHLKADRTYVDNIISNKASIGYVDSAVLNARKATVRDLNVTNGWISELRTDLIKTKNLVAEKANIADVLLKSRNGLFQTVVAEDNLMLEGNGGLSLRARNAGGAKGAIALYSDTNVEGKLTCLNDFECKGNFKAANMDIDYLKINKQLTTSKIVGIPYGSSFYSYGDIDVITNSLNISNESVSQELVFKRQTNNKAAKIVYHSNTNYLELWCSHQIELTADRINFGGVNTIYPGGSWHGYTGYIDGGKRYYVVKGFIVESNFG